MRKKSRALMCISPLPLAIAIVLYPSQSVANSFEFDQLCGQTLTEDLTVEFHSDMICGTCEITLADGVKLTILDSDLEFSGGGDNHFRITGLGNASLEIQRTAIDSGNLDHTWFNMNQGKIKALDNYFEADSDGGLIRFYSRAGMMIKDNIFQLSSTDTSLWVGGRGTIDFKGNEIDFGYANALHIWSDRGRLNIKGNTAVGGMASRFNVQSEYGADINIVDNLIPVEDDFDVFSDGGDIMIVDNMISVGEDLSIGTDGGDLAIISNDFGPPGDDIDIFTDGGRCRTKANIPTLVCF